MGPLQQRQPYFWSAARAGPFALLRFYALLLASITGSAARLTSFGGWRTGSERVVSVPEDGEVVPERVVSVSVPEDGEVVPERVGSVSVPEDGEVAPGRVVSVSVPEDGEVVPELVGRSGGSFFSTSFLATEKQRRVAEGIAETSRRRFRQSRVAENIAAGAKNHHKDGLS